MTHNSSRLATSLKAFAALVIVAGLPVYAHAEDASGAPKISVSVSDLDLTTAQGQATAHLRVERAANRICTNIVPLGEGMSALDGCVSEVANGAAPQLDQQIAEAQTHAQIRVAAAQPAATERFAQLGR